MRKQKETNNNENRRWKKMLFRVPEISHFCVYDIENSDLRNLCKF